MIRHIAALGLTLAAGFAQVSCSPVQRIADNANEIRTEANALAKHGEKVGDPVVVKGATRIETLAAGIHEDLASVEDKVPAWMSMVIWASIAAACVVAFAALWQSGALTAIRIAIGWIPRRKRQEADFIEAVLDPEKPESTREYIAARRAADPELNAALAAKDK